MKTENTPGTIFCDVCLKVNVIFHVHKDLLFFWECNKMPNFISIKSYTYAHPFTCACQHTFQNTP